MDIALSTMWAISRFPTLGGFFEAGERAGFTRFELNHGVTSEMLEGLEGRRITSVHEPCPADISTSTLKKNDWLISSLDEGRRLRGVLSIRRSIDLAVSVGAPAVVVHPGRVDSGYDTEPEMRRLFDEGLRSSSGYAELLALNREARAAAAPANLTMVRKSLAELSTYARARGIRLGLENRYHFHEFPSPDELGELISDDESGSIGFWYDAGHAETLSRLGFFPHEEWLDRFGDRIIGVHLHDVEGVDDHHFAGDGTLPWEKIVRRIPDSALRTCEFKNSCSEEELRKGLAFLKSFGL